MDKAKLQALYQPDIASTSPSQQATDDEQQTGDQTGDDAFVQTQTESDQDMAMLSDLKSSNQDYEIFGSAQVLPLMEAAADTLQKDNGLNIDVTAVGNDLAIDGVDNKEADAAMIYANLDAIKKKECARLLGNDGIALIVNKQSSLTGLTQDDIVSLFTDDSYSVLPSDTTANNGSPDSLVTAAASSAPSDASDSQLDPDNPLHIYMTDKPTHTCQMFENLLLIDQDDSGINEVMVPDTATIAQSDSEVLADVAHDPQGIGIVNMNNLPDSVKVLAIEGKKPSDDGYIAKIPLLLYFPDSDSPAAKVLTDFFNSVKGQRILSGNFQPVE